MSPRKKDIPWQDHPFAAAIADKDPRAAIKAARADADVIHLRLPSCYGWELPIHACVRFKSVALPRTLLDLGAAVDAPNAEGYTALFLAPECYTTVHVVRLLVERGADIHVDDDNPLWSAIWQASYGFGNTLPIIHYLVDKGSRPRGLHHAAEAGNLKIARIVADYGADVNEVDEHGFTPLDYCTGVAHTFQYKEPQNRPRVAAFLRERGAKNSGARS